MMKTLLIVYSGSDPQIIERELDLHHVGGYTELSRAHGTGASGRREGTRAWPGESTVFLSVVPDERVDALTVALVAARGALAPGERLHMAVLPTDTFL